MKVGRRPRVGAILRLMVGAAVVVGMVIGAGASAGAKGQANTRLTIDGGGGLVEGEVKSPDPNHCADQRKVLIFQVKNGSAEKVATDRATHNGDRYQWGRGFEGGKYFAKVNATSRCKGDKTETVRAGHL